VQTVVAHTTADLTNGNTYLLAVTADASGFPELVDITSGFNVNGWGREHRKFVKKIVTQTAFTGQTVLNTPWKTYLPGPGTVDTNAGNAAVVGTGTTFLLLKVGGTIRISGVERVIATITNNINLTTTLTWPSTLSGVTHDEVKGYAKLISAKTHVYVDATLAGVLVVGNTLRINSVDYQVSVVSGQDITITQNGVDGDYTGNVDQFYNPIYKTNQPTITDYQYAFQSNTDSSWYTDRVVEYIDQAGAEDALSIATAAHDNTGGQITAIASVRQRMLITYSGSMQLWAIDQDTNRTAYLDTLSFGTGDQPTPPAVPWYGSLVVPVENGIRSISVVGSNTDNLQDLNIGEPIEPLPTLSASTADFWPWYGQLMVAGTTPDGGVEFRCLDYSRESKITAWSRWTIAGLVKPDVGTLRPSGSNLWWRSGTALHRFDAKATVFRDYGDTVGNAYESMAFFHFNDLGKPGANKRWTGLDIVQDGKCSLAFALPPYGAPFEALTAGPLAIGPQIEGITYGRSRFPLALMASAIAPRITTRDETGWRLQRLALDFLMLRR
jgi:hypothetical protein